MEGAASKGKKTTVSTKTTVTTVTVEEPEAKKRDTVPKKSQGKVAGAALTTGPFSLPPPGPMCLPAGYGVVDQRSNTFPSYPHAVPGQHSPVPSILPRQDRTYALPSTSGQMPLQLPAIPGPKGAENGALTWPSSSFVAPHALDAKKSDGGKFVWLIYHKSGRHEAKLMGVYTSTKSALKNAKAMIDKQTSGEEERNLQNADLSDFSSNIKADQGVIYSVLYRGGGKDVVSFKKVKLNEDLSEGDSGNAYPPASAECSPALMGCVRPPLGWM